MEINDQEAPLLNTLHCPKSIPCGAILCCSCIRRLNTKVHASFIRGNKTKPISLPSNNEVAINIRSYRLAVRVSHRSHQTAMCKTPLGRRYACHTGLSWWSSSLSWVIQYLPKMLEAQIQTQQQFPVRPGKTGMG